MPVPDSSWGRTRVDVDRELAECREALAASEARTVLAESELADMKPKYEHLAAIVDFEDQQMALANTSVTVVTTLREQDLTARLAASAASRDEMAAALTGLMRRRMPNGDPCWCRDVEVAAHYPAHGYWCSTTRAVLGRQTARVAEPQCSEDRHIVLPSASACVCGENRSDLLL